MKYSEIALKLLIAKEWGIIKSNADFWQKYAKDTSLVFEEIFEQNQDAVKHFKLLNNLLENQDCVQQSTDAQFHSDFKNLFEAAGDDGGIICLFDQEFPILNQNINNASEKPYLLFFKGNLSLLSDLNNNVAVIGSINPDDLIVERERKIVTELVNEGLVIVSGLAKGCDTVAHETTLEVENGKTIAILPSPLHVIYPAINKPLAKNIVDNKGLIITEYFNKARSGFEASKMLIDRDRLQAMFSKAIILIASNREGDGDSGSRHAMEKAKVYQLKRYVVYDKKTDENNPKFGLNKDYHTNDASVSILTQTSISEIKKIRSSALEFINHQPSLTDFYATSISEIELNDKVSHYK